MEECALHLVVLAHTYVVPALKRLCTMHFEQGQLNIDNVVDILLIARCFLFSITLSHVLFCEVKLLSIDRCLFVFQSVSYLSA